MRPSRFAVAAAFSLLVPVLASGPPAAASSFPGANGKFAFYTGGGVIKTANADGTGVTTLLSSGGGTDEAWSPDGKQLAFVTVGIAAVNSDGTGLHQITTNQTDHDPTWSNDSTQIAFVRLTNGGGPNTDLMVANADGTGVTNLTSGISLAVSEPHWSPLGDKIAFVGDGQGLYVINPNGTGLSTVVSPSFDSREIAWSPDGQSIVFNHGADQIWVVDANGSNLQELVGSPTIGQVSDLAWSPDGTKIGFIGRWGSVDQLSVMGTNGSSPHSLGVNTLAYFDWQPLPVADLSVTKADAPDPVDVGQNVTYTITVTNDGPDPAFGTTLTDPLPAGVSLVSANSTQGACTGTTTITCSIGWMADSALVTVTIVVTANSAGTLSNTASASETNLTPDPVTSNNSDTEQTTVRCPPQFVTAWGTLGSGNGQFNYPSGVAIDGAGNVHVVDSNNDRVEKFTSAGAFLATWGGAGTGDGQLDTPGGISAVGESTVADTGNNRVEEFSYTGAFVRKWGTAGNGDGQFAGPSAVAVDGSGYVYVADAGNDRIQKFVLADGSFVAKWGSLGTSNGQFDGPSGIAVDDSGNVYVADSNNDRIEKFSSTGTFLTKWGSFGSGDGQFNTPYGVAVDGSGDVFVTDANNDRIQEFTSSGTFVTKWGPSGSGDGQFAGPTAVAVSGSGHVYVADSFNNRIQEFAPCAVPQITSFAPTSGKVGTSVMITGTGLTGAIGVKFNGTSATTFTDDSDTQITATVPSGATSGPISVTAPGGTAVSSSSFTVAIHKPDGKIKLGSDASYIGNNIYNLTATNQTRTVSAKRTITKTFDIAVQNDGNVTDGFRLKGLGSGTYFTVKYLAGLSGTTDITAAVVVGTYTLTSVAPNATKYIRMLITVKSTAGIGTSFGRLVTDTSTHDGTKKDAEKGVVTVIAG